MWDFKNLHEKFHEKIEEMQRLGGMRIWIIHVLDEGPKNGVEIMDAIEEHHKMIQKRHMNDERFRGHMMHSMKRPSPGSVYPMLKKMVEEKLIIKMDDGKYKLTEKGQEIASTFFGRFRPRETHMDRCGLVVENALVEIEGQVAFLESIKPEKLVQYSQRIKSLNEKIEGIVRSLNEDLEEDHE
jgi:DNA-binding PadR family transcriptional regulator